MRYFEFVTEALPLKTARKYRKAWSPERYEELFKKYTDDPKAYRIYLPLDQTKTKEPVVKVPNEIQKAVNDHGFTIDDYVAGMASKGNQKIKLGKVLQRIDPSLKSKFDSDPQRRAQNKSANLEVVISRHPYDVAGMSTNRGWTSCMSLTDGAYKKFVLQDVKGGTLIAYLIDSKDRNINKPKARMLIKPFVNEDGDFILMPESSVYGTASAAFSRTVTKWTKEVNGGQAAGLYCVSDKLYNDGMSTAPIIHKKPKNVSRKDLIDAIERGAGAKIWNLIKHDHSLVLMAIDESPSLIKKVKDISDEDLNEIVATNHYTFIHLTTDQLHRLNKEVFNSVARRRSDFIENILDLELIERFLRVNEEGVNYLNSKVPTEVVISYLEKKPNAIDWFDNKLIERPDIAEIIKHLVNNVPKVRAKAKSFLLKAFEAFIDAQVPHVTDLMIKILNLYPSDAIGYLDQYSYEGIPKELAAAAIPLATKKQLGYLGRHGAFTRAQSIEIVKQYPSLYDELDALQSKDVIPLIGEVPELLKFVKYNLSTKQIKRIIKLVPAAAKYLNEYDLEDFDA